MSPVDCPLTDDELSAFLEGALPLDSARDIANHILSCDRCARALGHVAAAETVLKLPADSAPYPELSEEFWPQLRARLDEVDRVMEATQVRETPDRRRHLPVIALSGIILILAAVLAHQLFMGSMSPVNPAELAYMHNRALATPRSADTGGEDNLATVEATDSGRFHGPHMIDLDGTPALSWHYLIGGRPVSVMFTTTDAVDTDQMQTIRVNGHPFHMLQTRAGTVLVDTSEDLWRVVVGRASPLEMVVLLRSIPRYGAFEQAMRPVDPQ
jgi:hypothetical protein